MGLNYLSIPKRRWRKLLTFEVRYWIRNFIPHSVMDLVTYPCWDQLYYCMLVKGAPRLIYHGMDAGKRLAGNFCITVKWQANRMASRGFSGESCSIFQALYTWSTLLFYCRVGGVWYSANWPISWFHDWFDWFHSLLFVISDKACHKITHTYNLRKRKITRVCIQHSKMIKYMASL